jgi:hypothetical protein
MKTGTGPVVTSSEAIMSATATVRARTLTTGSLVRTGVVAAAAASGDLIIDAAPATKTLLMRAHLVAAVIVIPAVARRLAA